MSATVMPARGETDNIIGEGVDTLQMVGQFGLVEIAV